MPKQIEDLDTLKDNILDQMGENENDPPEEELDEEDESEDEDEGESEEDEEEEDEPDEEGEDDTEDPDESGDRTKGKKKSSGEDKEGFIRVKPDKKGNLVDPRTGKIIAPAGPARRFYERMVNSERRLGQMQIAENKRLGMMQEATHIIKHMQGQLDALNKQETIGKQLGLSPEEQTEFLQLAAKFKDNNTALDTVKYLLTKAAQRGIDIKSLGVTGAFDIKALTDEIAKKFEPLTQTVQQQQNFQKAQNEVRTEIRNFLTTYPDAKDFLDVLSKMLQTPQFQGKSLEVAWLNLKNHLLERSRRAKQRNGRGPDGRKFSRPSGRSSPGIVREEQDLRVDNSPVDVDTEYKEIVKQVMEDFGGIST